ncbi:LPPG:FO 2-phospho-L-lactate transferase [Jatrophihabitans endophyticus]|uniref:LPPG:FO 2-phospho-L-lactate transferase n=1 Tax=Jatrophihabitans endophyticus TaxID=1206085 RepID=A0A1M5RL25_9ACTN|nr:2-phospho-L-lactate transferase [Jatrophihabitans endophyticus]SHH26935.1 LPPG:FO 2-phospho-L-lactate transferase [Jatrophihabitans endophyticus]
MRIAVLAGGIGGARFLRGVRAARPDDDITAVVNTGDDVTLHGLRICPDLDSVMYTLGGVHDGERGWGRKDETWRIKDELTAYGAEPSWFGLGDLDVATHLVRTRMLEAGFPLSEVTAALCERWQPGVTLLPMTDDRCETHVVVELAEPGDAEGSTPRRRAIHFQEWWVRHRASVPAQAFVQVGAEHATPAPGVLETITGADVVLLAPSNPVVSIGTVLGVPGIRDALVSGSAPVVGLSPIVGNAPVRGMADSCLPAIGVEVSAEGVGRHYGARSEGGLLDGWLVHETDTARVPGVAVAAVPLLMSDDDATAAMVKTALELVA